MHQSKLQPDAIAPIQLAVEIKGKGMPILCLHGHPGSGSSMSVFTNSLAQRFQTIAPDLRGYGRSQTNQPFEMSAHLVDLEALLDRYQVSECIVLGWSLGGILAIELALHLPKTIKGLILVATAARPRSNHPPVTLWDNAYTGLASVINRVYPGWQWNIDTFGKRSLYRYLIQQHTTGAYHYLANEGMAAYLQTSAAANRALQTALNARYDRLTALNQISCPCLVLAGAADRHITAASSLETAQNLENCEAICYPNVAHLFPWEIPAQVLTDVNRWLSNHFPDQLS
jgi:pimeloyl-ACP methyl ester carboxylesterase